MVEFRALLGITTQCPYIPPSYTARFWIGTADIKDLYVEERPFLGLVADLIKKGKEVRLIHAKEPGPNFREDFDHYPVLFTGLERALCPRVHFKIIIFDLQMAYIGSANLTGAGIGMKSTRTRNFEAGILTDDPALVEAAINQFDSVWAGFKCKDCARKKYCGDAGDVEGDDGGLAFRGEEVRPRCGMGYQLRGLHLSPTLGCLKKICEGPTDWLYLFGWTLMP